MKKFAFAFGLAAMVMFTAPAWAADGKALVGTNKCGSCHKLQGPAVTTIAEILKRKAPDLFYAGSKFNKDWLVGFIQSPTVIRPAGTVYSNNIKTDASQQDVIVTPPKCASKLSAGDAAAVADYLMTLKDSGMKTGFTPGKFSKARARMLLTKKQPCNACHTLPKRGGGVSCPTFEGIGARLNPDWMYSFIKNPQHWDPKIWMASGDYDEKTMKLMVNYLISFK